MCPAGRRLRRHRDQLLGRLRWLWHATHCPTCAETYAADEFLDRVADRPLPTPRRATVLAAATAVVLVVALPLVSAAVWHRNTLDTNSARTIRNVHWVGEQSMDDLATPYEESIEYPGKTRVRQGSEVIITDQRAGRQLLLLAHPASLSWHPQPYRYVLRPWSGGAMRTRESFTLVGNLRPHDGREVLRDEVSVLRNERESHVLTYRGDSGPGVLKLEVDPDTHLVLAWEETAQYESGGARHTWRMTAARVEYNTDLPEGYFSTARPEGEEVLDQLTPEGITKNYLGALAELDKLSDDPAQQRALAKEYNDRELFDRLRMVEPLTRQRLIARLERYGITRYREEVEEGE